ncbi:MAG: phytoene/squalene synthase family protein [Methyloceanibacter sp.]|uniref:phytoene/squalene synthase family protein n=1 Tax=Methyloceanibacter sp. TaxID=1965321 RepID=UPI003D6D96D8
MHDAERADTVRRIARAADPDRALAALFAPPGPRADLFALYAFNAELARIADQVTEPGLGDLRLQWWREAIDRAAAGEAAGHAVAGAFGAAIKRRALNRERIAALIDARSFDVGAVVIPDEASLDAYLFDTAIGLFALAAQIVGADGEGLDLASEAAGRAYGLTGLMRALPIHASKGRVYLPADALRRHGTSPEAVLAGETSAGLEALLKELRARARGAYVEAQGHLAGIDPRGRTAFLPLSLVEPYLLALERSRDPLHEVAAINPLYRLWRMATRR